MYGRFPHVTGRRPSGDLLPLDEATRRLRPFSQRFVGVRPIDVSQIVGTDSRGRDFDREFSPRRPEVRARLRELERAFPDADFPPISVYRIGDAYFVIDGHHRVALARRRGMQSIDAEVIELKARWRLPADADLVELVHAEQERIFMAESGLADSRPDVRLRFTRPVGYAELLETVQVHGYHLMLDAPGTLTRADIAGDWYTSVYLPTLEVIHAERLDEVCPEVTDPDRFLWVYKRRRERVPEHGAQPLGEAARIATEELARERRRVGRRLLARSRG